MRFLLLLSLLFFLGCGQSSHLARSPKSSAPKQISTAQAELLQPFVMAHKPAGALSVQEALQRRDGETVVVSGRTPTEKVKPFNAALAAWILVPPEILDREDVQQEFDCDEAAT
jgi:hypothetical protein